METGPWVGFREEQLTLIAHLLAAEGETWCGPGEWEKASAAFRKALRILLYPDEGQAGLYDFDRKYRIGELKDHVEGMGGE